MTISLSKSSYLANGVMVGRLVLSGGQVITLHQGVRNKVEAFDFVQVYHGMNEPPGLQWCRYGDLVEMPERGPE